MRMRSTLSARAASQTACHGAPRSTRTPPSSSPGTGPRVLASLLAVAPTGTDEQVQASARSGRRRDHTDQRGSAAAMSNLGDMPRAGVVVAERVTMRSLKLTAILAAVLPSLLAACVSKGQYDAAVADA